jgi:hypothetical protein
MTGPSASLVEHEEYGCVVAARSGEMKRVQKTPVRVVTRSRPPPDVKWDAVSIRPRICTIPEKEEQAQADDSVDVFGLFDDGTESTTRNDSLPEVPRSF